MNVAVSLKGTAPHSPYARCDKLVHSWCWGWFRHFFGQRRQVRIDFSRGQHYKTGNEHAADDGTGLAHRNNERRARGAAVSVEALSLEIHDCSEWADQE